MQVMDYDHERDFEAVRRIWLECGWIEDEENYTQALRTLIPAMDCIVFPVDGVAECSVMSTPGFMRHGGEDVPLGVVAAVTTSHVARRMGAAAVLTAHALARQAEAGAAVSALGMFEQGFYDRIGFGSGSYVSVFRFDPATLDVPRNTRPPRRIGPDRWQDMHAAMLARRRGHGGCNLTATQNFRAELRTNDPWFGLGYCDGPDGALTHFVWGVAKGEHGPYEVRYMAWQNDAQLFELLGALAALGDQVSTVVMPEPPEVQFQDLLRQPFRNRGLSRGSRYEGRHDAEAWWQLRMLDVEACLARTRLDAETLRFNLTLSDPVDRFLDGRNGWRGTAGEYTVTLGEESSAEPGHSARLPALTASVGAFSRMWIGVRPASSLALTDGLAGDSELLHSLDRALRLPPPFLGWDF